MSYAGSGLYRDVREASPGRKKGFFQYAFLLSARYPPTERISAGKHKGKAKEKAQILKEFKEKAKQEAEQKAAAANIATEQG